MMLKEFIDALTELMLDTEEAEYALVLFRGEQINRVELGSMNTVVMLDTGTKISKSNYS